MKLIQLDKSTLDGIISEAINAQRGNGFVQCPIKPKQGLIMATKWSETILECWFRLYLYRCRISKENKEENFVRLQTNLYYVSSLTFQNNCHQRRIQWLLQLWDWMLWNDTATVQTKLASYCQGLSNDVYLQASKAFMENKMQLINILAQQDCSGKAITDYINHTFEIV